MVNGEWIMVNGLATYPFAENTSNEPLMFLLVIPNEREGSRRIGLARPSGRDSSAPLGMTSRVILVVLIRFSKGIVIFLMVNGELKMVN